MKNTIYLLSLACLVASCGPSDAEKRLMEKVDGVYSVYIESTDPYEVAMTQRGMGPYYNHFMTYKLYIDGRCEMISPTDSTVIKLTGTWTASSNEDDGTRTIKMEWPSSTMIMTGGQFDDDKVYEMEGAESLGFIRHKREFFDKYVE